MKRTRLTALILALLTLTLCLSSCGNILKTFEDEIAAIIDENSAGEKVICITVLDAFTSGSALPEEISEESIKELNSVFGDEKEYELRAVGWYENTTNGVSTKEVTFKLTVPGGRIASIETLTDPNTGELLDINVNDVTDFASKEGTFKLINAILKIISLLFVAFAAWMLIDCVKRNLKLKPLWIFIILAGLLITVSSAREHFSANVGVGVILSLSDLEFSLLEERIDFNILLPVGAVVYLFARKRLPLKPDENVEQTIDVEELLSDDTDETKADGEETPPTED